ncbi:glycoside hydrolase family 36 protein [Nonomuraea lactucae]|uniref:glycoside hydrolase family 36 protein n=1 Tax=Nonomuraea lactucae TaxID=2249762 RepID=UPI0019633C77|nr:glycoside hydrolase family 36 protein [Nonomuraea lactucae]
MTTAERPAAPTRHLIDDVTVAVLAAGTPAPYTTRELPGGLVALDVSAPEGTPLEIRLASPLRDAVGFWHPACGWERSLLPDWAGRMRTSLVNGAAVGCLYQTSGATLLAFAAEDPLAETEVVFGVSEQSRTFVVHLHPVARAAPYTLVLAPRSASVAAALRRLRAHLRGHAPITPLPTPETAWAPVYSTWYAFGQNVTAAEVEEEAELAAGLGCGVLILDDGWQEYGTKRGYAWAGDWTVDTAKFPDLAGHVARVRATGMSYLAWIAPLLLGPESRAYPRLAHLAPVASPTGPGAYVLDPRVPEVREHVVATCVRLIRDYGLDGLKIDFLDDAGVYSGAGAAMADLLGALRAALPAGSMIELRQPYLGHGMAAYGNLLRATDCPADATANRVRTIDAGLLALGGAVHSDMLMWDPEATPAWAARQLLSVLQAVPQISNRLTEMRADHREWLAFWLRQWERLRPVLLDGDVEPGRPDELYPVISARTGDREVIVLHADRVAAVDLSHREIDLVNVTAADRIVIEVSQGAADVQETVYDARGRLVGTRSRSLRPGVTVLTVPPSGLVSLRIADPRRAGSGAPSS